MDSIITAALTAASVPDGFSEENSSSLVTSSLCLTEKREQMGWRLDRAKRFSGILYRQRARQNTFKQLNISKSFKWQVSQWSSNLLQANPADSRKEIHFMCGVEAQQEINPAGNVQRNIELKMQRRHLQIRRDVKSKDGRAVLVWYKVSSYKCK